MSQLALKIGTTLRLRITRTDNDGLPRDLSEIHVASAVRLKFGGVVKHLNVDLSEASQGVVTLFASAEETATWPQGDYWLDIKYTDSAGTVIAEPSMTNIPLSVIRGATP